MRVCNGRYLRILWGIPDKWRCLRRSTRSSLGSDTDTAGNRSRSLAARFRSTLWRTGRSFRPPCCADKCTGLRITQTNVIRPFVVKRKAIKGDSALPQGPESVVFTRVRVANRSVTVTIAWDARREWAAASRLVPGAGRARFAKLSYVSFGARAHLHPVSWQTGSASPGRLQREIVQKANA